MRNAETFLFLHKQNLQALDTIKMYIESTPWCEESQEAADECDHLAGFLGFFKSYFPKMMEKMLEHGLTIETGDD